VLAHGEKLKSVKGKRWKSTIDYGTVAMKEKEVRDANVRELKRTLAKSTEQIQIDKLEKMVHTLLETDNILIRNKLREGYNLLNVENVLKISLHRTHHRWIRRAFSVWKDGVLREKEYAKINKTTKENLSRNLKAMVYVLKTLMHKNLSRAIRRWQSYVQVHNHFEELDYLHKNNVKSQKELALHNLRRSTERWRHRNLSHGWNGWIQYMDLAVEEDEDARLRREMEAERRKHKVKAMTYILDGMIHKQLHRAMRTWQSHTQIHAHFNELQEMHEDNKKKRKELATVNLHRAMERWKHLNLSYGWNSWVTFFQLTSEEDEDARLRREMEAERRKHKVKAMTYILDGMIHKQLHQAMRAWQSHTQIHAHFNELQEMHEDNKKKRKELATVNLHRAMERWRHLNLSYGWNSWISFFELTLEKEKESRVQQKYHRVISKNKVKAMTYILDGMIHKQLHRAMRTWQSYVQIHNHFNELSKLREENEANAKELEQSKKAIVEKCRVALLKAADAHERHMKREKESNRMIHEMSKQMKEMSDEIKKLNLEREKMTRVVEQRDMEIQTRLEEERSRASSLEIESRILRNELRSVESLLPSLKAAAERATRFERDQIQADLNTSFRERKMEQDIEMLRTQLLESERENAMLRRRLQQSEARSREVVRDMENRYMNVRSDLWRTSISLSASKPSPPPPQFHHDTSVSDFEEFESVHSATAQEEEGMMEIKTSELGNVTTKLFWNAK